MVKSLANPKGILYPKAGQQAFTLTRHLPSSEMAYFVEHYWIVTWDRRGQPPYTSQTLPYPSVHLTIEPHQSRIVGVVMGKFCTMLEGEGRVFGIKFRPGAFYPFIASPVSALTNLSLGLADVFGAEGIAFEQELRGLHCISELIDLAEKFLYDRHPERDKQIEQIHRIIDLIISDRLIKKVDDLAARMHLSTRTLQRLFSQYVGVSPKWVIQRYRLHEAAEQVAQEQTADWARMALDLGYFDQAHFIKDFKTIVGMTPAVYGKRAAS